jgi:hypothetical protein
MPPAKDKPPTPEYRYDPGRGEHQLGVRFDGHFVPFASVSVAYATQLVENATQAATAAEASESEGE